ncbi:hypothetical protein LTR78_002832 [Recurvomyces mirabilis]|uniref:Uncharacterized protein n=1 Tax=Recurvomyces mirabilis TaxID=574656 RepID=A0AAE0WTG2_9PEZI|nr:hypothetical protein LTR78_002832 [Recurvomyces mirabilis]KAK5159435.1 hypothetical protein LTS14_002577 [Recurvomyces mirabilis]
MELLSRKYSKIVILATSALGIVAVPSSPTTDQEERAYVPEITALEGIQTDRLANTVETDTTSNSGVIKRGFGTPAAVTCTGFTIASQDDYESARNCFEAWLGVAAYHWKSPGQWWYYCQTGKALLGLYNYAGLVRGDAGEVNTFHIMLDDQCGMWQNGYIDLPKWAKTYWRSRAGAGSHGNPEAPCAHNNGRDLLNDDPSWQG